MAAETAPIPMHDTCRLCSMIPIAISRLKHPVIVICPIGGDVPRYHSIILAQSGKQQVLAFQFVGKAQHSLRRTYHVATHVAV